MNMCNKLKSRLKKALVYFDNYVDAHVDTALQITMAIQKLLNSPVLDVLTTIIPGQVDNIIRSQMQSALNTAVDALSIADACKSCTDLNSKLSCFMNELKKMHPDLQDAILQKLASLIAAHLHNNKLQQCFYDLFTQSKYTSLK